MKGVKGYIKGHTPSEETRMKISKALNKKIKFNCGYCKKEAFKSKSHFNKTKRHYCCRDCYSKDREENWKPEDNHAWKGGIAKANQSGRGCKKYKEWQRNVMDKCSGTCVCGEDAECCHHLKGWTEFPELRYDIGNGIALCNPCHYKIHYENPELLEDL